MSAEPKKIQVVCDDGSIREADMAKIPEEIKEILVVIGLIPVPEEQSRKSVLVEWKDGWKEVYAAPENAVDIRKYCVISRNEQVGRLFLDKAEGYPELVEIRRKPLEIEKVSLV